MQNISEIKDKIRQITLGRRQTDNQLSDLQVFIKQKIPKITLQKSKIQLLSKIDSMKKKNEQYLQILTVLKNNTQKLQKQGIDVTGTKLSIESLKEYYIQSLKKIKQQHKLGQSAIFQRQRWEITGNQDNLQNQESSLIMTVGKARQVRQQAANVLGQIENQGDRLKAARQKMSDVLGNINLSGNIVNLLKRRSSEDNRLIFWLTLGLFVEIYLCVYWIRPMFRSG